MHFSCQDVFDNVFIIVHLCRFSIGILLFCVFSDTFVLILYSFKIPLQAKLFVAKHELGGISTTSRSNQGQTFASNLQQQKIGY